MPYEALITADEPLVPRMLERVMERRGDEPLTVQSTDGGGAVSICTENGDPVITVYAPMRFEFDDELQRIFPTVAERIALPAFVHEVLIGRDHAALGEELGSALARTIDAAFLALVPADAGQHDGAEPDDVDADSTRPDRASRSGRSPC